MYGQDADLIMLGLASHEPHFALLREVINFNRFNPGRSIRQTVIRQTKDAQFQLLHLSILREYIAADFASAIQGWIPDQERLIDDFIFLTFLVGNDFLPHLPTLDISEHAFDVIIDAYSKVMKDSPGYLVSKGEIGDMDRLEKLFAIIGQQEADILERREVREKKMANKKRRMRDEEEESDSEEDNELAEEALEAAYQECVRLAIEQQAEEGTNDDWQVVGASKERESKSQKVDALGSVGVNKDYRGRYYYNKFKVFVNLTNNDNVETFLLELRTHYLKGLMWCLAYYIKGGLFVALPFETKHLI